MDSLRKRFSYGSLNILFFSTLAVVGFYLLLMSDGEEKGDLVQVGRVVMEKGSVQIRKSRFSGWSTANENTPVYDRTTLYTRSKSEVKLQLRDSEVRIGENTLVQIVDPNRSNEINMDFGDVIVAGKKNEEVVINVGGERVRLKLNGGVAKVHHDSTHKKTVVEAVSGEVEVRSSSNKVVQSLVIGKPVALNEDKKLRSESLNTELMQPEPEIVSIEKIEPERMIAQEPTPMPTPEPPPAIIEVPIVEATPEPPPPVPRRAIVVATPTPEPPPAAEPEPIPQKAAQVVASRPLRLPVLFAKHSVINIRSDASYFSVTGVDKTNGSQGRIASDLSPGIELAWAQKWAVDFSTDILVKAQGIRFKPDAGGRQITNSTLMNSSVGIGASIRPFDRLWLAADLSYAQAIFYRALEPTSGTASRSNPGSLEINQVPLIVLRPGFRYTFFRKRPYLAAVTGSYSYFNGSQFQNYKIDPGYGYQGGLSIGQDLHHKTVDCEFLYRERQQNTTLLRFSEREAAVNCGLKWLL